MKNFLCLPIFFLVFLVSSCSKNEDEGSISASTTLNLAYGPQPLQNMDLYLPADRSSASTKLLIMVHGGGWSAGDKADLNQFVDSMKRRLPGYAIANINYRLASGTTNLFPTQEMDVKAAVEFIVSQKMAWGISDQFVLLGASAGGHLALLHGFKYNSPVKVKAIVDFFGPSDMVAMYTNPAIFAPASAIVSIMGGTPASQPTLYYQSSPVNFINAQSPPTIVLQGGLDPLVSPAQSEAVINKLNAVAVPNQYVFYPSGGHGDWSGATYTDAFNKIQLFLETNVP
jgi:acetyl esterase/lipase